MRNLKKILALVLALIMSLSLMATAGAADFTDAADITDTFEESVDVLDGLKVFQGYPGGDFQPQGEIKRSEVAVIIYRIATGDIEGTQVGIYKDHNKFSDVTSSHWAAGYINYCANAEYIKGRSAKIFDPEGRVTGYEALAMILRAIGYDKNNEFTGSSWKIQTAATAKQRGIIENINEGLLGQAATREMVAEILCQTILVNQVNYTPAFGYQEGNTTLGYDTFKLEKLTGVVTGNEYADLESTSAMGNDITRLVVGERKLNLQVESYFDDIGETRYTYVRPTDKSEYTLVTSKLYEEEGANDVKESGDATSVSSLAGSLRTDGDTQYFVNYDESREWKSDIRIAYYIDKEDADIMGWDDFLEDVVGRTRFLRRDPAGNDIPWDDTTSQHPGADTFAGYYRWIQPGEEILPTDRTILKAIFDDADLQGMIPSGTTTPTIPTTNIVIGEVYVGTQSKTDISDSISWTQFVSTYVGDEMEKVSGTTNGNYLKVIDNDNDGNVEYVLRTDFVLDEVAAMNGDKVFYRNTNGTGIANNSTVRYQSGEYKYDGTYKYNDTPELSTGTVVVAAQIEGTWYAQICAPVTATIKTINFTVPSATTTEDAEYKQSAILNNTTMPELLVEMSELTEYGVYLDLFGHLRAYDAPVSGRYALLTEMYAGANYNANYVRNIPWTVEMMTPGTTYPVESSVLNPYPNTRENVFIDNERTWNYGVLTGRNDYLQSAIDHLGLNSLTAQGKALGGTPADNGNASAGNGDNIRINGNKGEEFDWTTAPSGKVPSYTNVAKYTKSGDGVYLYTASEFATKTGTTDQLYYGWHDTDNNDVVSAGDVIYELNGTVKVLTAADLAGNGMYKGHKFTANEWTAYVTRYGTNLNVAGAPAVIAGTTITSALGYLEPVYAEDYIQMEVEDIAAGDRQFTMTNYKGTSGYTGYVEATHNTEFYVVGPNITNETDTFNRSIKHFTGYTGLTAYDGTVAHRASDIAAIYAVAKNTTANSDGADYWVADVIVIELATDHGMTYNSVSLTYSIPSMTTANIRQANALNNETVGVKQVLYPNNVDWGNNLERNWFYGLTDTQTFEDGVKANLHRITYGRYNANGIYAGTVVSVNGNYGGGAYLAMDTIADGSATTTMTINTSEGGNPVPIYAVALGSATELQIVDTSRNSQISAGDRLIWVYNSDRQIDFIINASYYARHSTTPNADLFKNGANDMYTQIINEQSYVPVPEALNVLFYDVTDRVGTVGDANDQDADEHEITVTYAKAKALADDLTVEITGDYDNAMLTDNAGTIVAPKTGTTGVWTLPLSPNSAVTYKLYITKDGVTTPWTLTQLAGGGDTNLYKGATNNTTPATPADLIFDQNPTTVGTAMGVYHAKAPSTASWVIFDENNERLGTGEECKETTIEVGYYAIVTVTAENGETKEWRIELRQAIATSPENLVRAAITEMAESAPGTYKNVDVYSDNENVHLTSAKAYAKAADGSDTVYSALDAAIKAQIPEIEQYGFSTTILPNFVDMSNPGSYTYQAGYSAAVLTAWGYDYDAPQGGVTFNNHLKAITADMSTDDYDLTTMGGGNAAAVYPYFGSKDGTVKNAYYTVKVLDGEDNLVVEKPFKVVVHSCDQTALDVKEAIEDLAPINLYRVFNSTSHSYTGWSLSASGPMQWAADVPSGALSSAINTALGTTYGNYGVKMATFNYTMNAAGNATVGPLPTQATGNVNPWVVCDNTTAKSAATGEGQYQMWVEIVDKNADGSILRRTGVVARVTFNVQNVELP